MTGERASVVFGETLSAAPFSVSLQKNIFEAVSHPRKAGYPSV